MTNQADIAKRLADIAKELSLIAGALGQTELAPPVFPAEAVRKFAAGICLGGCGRTKATHTLRRGNCPTCSAKVNAEIKSLGPLGERALIEPGRIAPIGFDPNPSDIDRDLQEAAEKVRKASKGHTAEEIHRIATEEAATRRKGKGK